MELARITHFKRKSHILNGHIKANNISRVLKVELIHAHASYEQALL